MTIKITKAVAKKIKSHGFVATDEGNFTVIRMEDNTLLAQTEDGTAQALFEEALENRDKLSGSEVGPSEIKDNNTVEPSESDDNVIDEAFEDEEDEEQEKLNVVPKKYRDEYKARGDASCCGDEFSQLFKTVVASSDSKTIDAGKLNEIGGANGIDVMARWGQRNVGMRRMNLGNMLRTKLKKDGEIWWPNDAGKLTADQAGIEVKVSEEKEEPQQEAAE